VRLLSRTTGPTMLMGLVAKNAILLIDFARWSHARGTPMRDALIEAAPSPRAGC
jgi:multidrug efflux pump subunit AcrB